MDLRLLCRAFLPQRSPISGSGSSLPCGAHASGCFHSVCHLRETSHNKKRGRPARPGLLVLASPQTRGRVFCVKPAKGSNSYAKVLQDCLDETTPAKWT